MKRQTQKIFCLCLMLTGSIGQVLAEPISLEASAPYEWYDGDKKQTIWLNPSLLAEFSPADSSATAGLQPLTRGSGSVRLLRIDPAVTSRSSAQIASQMPSGKYSPVLHDGAFEHNRMRALPGNIIVHLKPEWTEEDINDWLQRNGLRIVKPLNIGPNIFVIHTAPGLAALGKANELYLAGEVVAAYPDWWVEVHKR